LTKQQLLDRSHPSPLVKKFASVIVNAAPGYPVIDVACGAGRNAFYLAQLGCTVICIDRDLHRLKERMPDVEISKRLTLIEMDLLADPWPFGERTIGGIVLVDFLDRSLFPLFERSLVTGSYLLIETISNRGGNYLELPRAGELRQAFERSLEFNVYREREAGPRTVDAVTVRMLGRRQ
jgi:SAM-dependent methyltransferase